MNKIYNPYFSVEIKPDQVQAIKDIIIKNFKNFNLNFEELENPHITVSYLLGGVERDNLESLAEEISEASFKIRVVGLEVLESSYYGGSLIVLKLEDSEDFLYAREYIEENLSGDNVSIKKYKGGFKAHISLFLLKDIPNMGQKNKLIRYLEICLADLNPKVISGNSFCIYDSQRTKLIEKKFK